MIHSTLDTGFKLRRLHSGQANDLGGMVSFEFEEECRRTSHAALIPPEPKPSGRLPLIAARFYGFSSEAAAGRTPRGAGASAAGR